MYEEVKMRKRIISFIISVIVAMEFFMSADGTAKVYAYSAQLEQALQWATAIANDNSHGYTGL